MEERNGVEKRNGAKDRKKDRSGKMRRARLNQRKGKSGRKQMKGENLGGGKERMTACNFLLKDERRGWRSKWKRGGGLTG